MQPIDCLDCRRRIEKRSVGQRPLGDVDEHPQAEGHVLVKSPFGALDRAHRGVGSIRSGAPAISNSGAPAGTNSPSDGRSVRTQFPASAIRTSSL